MKDPTSHVSPGFFVDDDRLPWFRLGRQIPSSTEMPMSGRYGSTQGEQIQVTAVGKFSGSAARETPDPQIFILNFTIGSPFVAFALRMTSGRRASKNASLSHVLKDLSAFGQNSMPQKRSFFDRISGFQHRKAFNEGTETSANRGLHG